MRLVGDGLSFRYGAQGREILNSFSFEIKSGEIVGLSAPSGFGKTTLCKIMGGYLVPDSGNVMLDGSPILGFKGYCPVQMIWQHPELVINPRLKLLEVLAEVGGVDERVMDGLGIERAWLNRYPAELSGGELQRFCIARALKLETRFILADEISTMLDLITQAQIWQYLKAEALRRNIGVLVVSHQDSLLDVLCTRRLKLDSN